MLVRDVESAKADAQRVEEEVCLLALDDEEIENRHTHAHHELHGRQEELRNEEMKNDSRRKFEEKENPMRERTMMMIATSMSGSTNDATKCAARRSSGR